MGSATAGTAAQSNSTTTATAPGTSRARHQNAPPQPGGQIPAAAPLRARDVGRPLEPRRPVGGEPRDGALKTRDRDGPPGAQAPIGLAAAGRQPRDGRQRPPRRGRVRRRQSKNTSDLLVQDGQIVHEPTRTRRPPARRTRAPPRDRSIEMECTAAAGVLPDALRSAARIVQPPADRTTDTSRPTVRLSVPLAGPRNEIGRAHV